MNITVIAESTPGPIAINAATYVGFRQAGILGAVFATVGMITPSLGIIYIISITMHTEFLGHAFPFSWAWIDCQRI